MSFFVLILLFQTRQIPDFLVFSQLFLTPGQLLEYYLLTWSIDTTQSQDMKLKTFLVKIAPCVVHVGHDENFKIFVDSTVFFYLKDTYY